MDKQQYFAVLLGALVLGTASMGGALAGEVTGRPDAEDAKPTGAPENANSNCAYSGLNDFDVEEGQNESIVQVVADAWKYYGLPHGFAGTSGACHGGTNLQRDK